MSGFDRRVWFRTSTGLGRTVAEVALENSEIVVATARQPSSLDNLAQRYSKDRLLVLPLDVTHPEQVAEAFSHAIRTFGRVDVVFNNAGKGDIGEFEAMEDSVARSMLETNFWGAVSVTKEAVKCFRESNPPGAGGRLLQMSSVLGLVGLPVFSSYAASKFALEGSSETLAAELDPAWNIKVGHAPPSLYLLTMLTSDHVSLLQITIIEPGYIRSELARRGTLAPEHPAYRQNPDLPTTHMRRIGFENIPTWKDTRRSAEAFYKIACVPDPPLHFVVGKDAIAIARKKIAALTADIDTYEKLSEGLEE
ncbi:hypothetical protein GSI_02687 [Ganoderma sinense ZZ0214-1]|uniref:Uncharacterized protein n=1 Tax=Ganoderma sinense ZZ0214-1 TaxID=1077348 RepID=A0A2G8SMB9_9APHY|nr:hypothetical protein GSI_02687 [Ganoderma sinense ZZ0214-1]